MTNMTNTAAARDDAAADPRWTSVVRRDRTADGSFWYSVDTTGVFCRPSCPSRQAKPENVRFHDSVDAARTAGFRPCRRCCPDGLTVEAANAALVARVCALIDGADQAPSLAAMADAVELSPTYFHRVFRAATGLTPKQYAAGRRADRVRQALDRSRTVTEAIHAAGAASSGRFYADARASLGMAPGRYRAGGTEETLRFAVGRCDLGAVLVAASAEGIVAITLGDDPDFLAEELQARFPRATLRAGDPAFGDMVAQVIGLVEAPGLGVDLPLDIRGTAFQRRVWQALRQIPAGHTASYAEIAARIGAPRAVRAVAGACAANGLAVAIPCHRVVRQDAGPSGFRWGAGRRRALLLREQAARG